MLLEFTVENFKSIKDSLTFSMLSGSKNTINKFAVRNYELLTSAIVFGANASGKSNILAAFGFMKSMVLNYHKIFQSTDRLPHEPFRLSTETESASSSFEVVFFDNNIKFRYGFEADSTTVYSEWLFCDEKGKEAKLFYRDVDYTDIYINSEKFIWKCDQEGGEIAGQILKWFGKVNMLHGMDVSQYSGYTLRLMEEESFRSEIVKLITFADLGIKDILIDKEKMTKSDFEKMFTTDTPKKVLLSNSNMKPTGVQTRHKKYDETGNDAGIIDFDLLTNESEGTRKFFYLSAPFLDTLKKGTIILVDELDASLHPMLTMALVSLFNDKNINKNNAQIIFTTHDTNLLNLNIFHKSQIWFSEKDAQGETHLSSLVEYKNIRSSDNIEKNYISGKYGAIPFLGSFTLGEKQ